MLTSQLLANGLDIIPTDWALTPILNKSPLRPFWQDENPISRDELLNLLKHGQKLWSNKKQQDWLCRWTGYGLRTGEVSGGLVALDVDGFSAEPILTEIFANQIPKTVSWTSGKPGKRQLLFQLPPDVAAQVKGYTRSVITEWNELKTLRDEQGKVKELLEIRYNACQSALPPSKHPETQLYKWINSPATTAVAEAPAALCDLIIKLHAQAQVKVARQRQKQSQNSTKTVQIDLELDPFDMRNLAQYLDGYNPQGRRRGWITCKCPVHNGYSRDSLHIEASTGAFKCHAGCDPKQVYRAASAIALDKGHVFKRSQKKGIKLGHLLRKCQKKIKEQINKCQWLLGKKDKIELEQPTTNYKVTTYKQGGRWKLVKDLKDKGFKVVVDITETGGGKSHSMGNVPLTQLGLQHAFYVTNDPRNPSCEALSQSNGWILVEGRNEGTKIDDFGRIRLTKDGEHPDFEPNCSRVQTISLIRSYGIKNADNSDLICQGCNNYELCRSGVKFGYLNDRIKAFDFKHKDSKKWRIHPKSLPSAEPQLVGDKLRQFPYSSCIVMFEEAQESCTNHESLIVTLSDVEKLICHLLEYPELLKAVTPVLLELKKILSGQIRLPNKYGFSHNQLLEKLPKCDVDLTALAEATKPNFSLLNKTCEYRVDISDLPRDVRKKFNDSDSATATNLVDNLLKQFGVPLFNILAGGKGHLTAKYDKLSKTTQLVITYQNNHLIKIVQQAGLVYLADATANPEEFLALLGLKPDEIAVIREEVAPINNLNIIQVGDLGRLGKARGNDQIKRVATLIEFIQDKHVNTMCIRFDKYKQAGDHRHFVESRSVQDGADKDVLIIDGTPTPNIDVLKAIFACIYHYVPTDETVEVKYPVLLKGVVNRDGDLASDPSGIVPYFKAVVSADPKFREFVRQRILAIIHQEIGRLRANRRPSEQLTVYILSGYPLDVPVTLVSARDITPDAASKEELILKSVQDAIATLQKQGWKATQTAIADLVGITQQHVSRLLKKLTHFALDPTKSKMCITNELYNSPHAPTSDVGKDTQEAEVDQQLADNYQPSIAVLKNLLKLTQTMKVDSIDEMFFFLLQYQFFLYIFHSWMPKPGSHPPDSATKPCMKR